VAFDGDTEPPPCVTRNVMATFATGRPAFVVILTDNGDASAAPTVPLALVGDVATNAAGVKSSGGGATESLLGPPQARRVAASTLATERCENMNGGRVRRSDNANVVSVARKPASHF